MTDEIYVPHIADITVQKMQVDDNAPTAPLEEFIAAYEDDDNWWWIVSCGHHMNLFDAAIERIRELEAKLEATRG